jgi:two-component system, OmpR family, phosphate regulon response regulator PhoB
LILDWMLPGVSGIELCRRLRQRPETERLPIIMLTARGEESERVRGLATGADDYVVKPFSTPELMARVKAMLRRAKPEVLSTLLKCGDIELDRETHRVHRKTREVRLGPTEFQACWNSSWLRQAASFRARNFWTVSGVMTSMSMSARSTSMSAACARR